MTAESCVDKAEVMVLSENGKLEPRTMSDKSSNDFSAHIGENLSAYEKYEILKLLDQYSDVFANDESNVGKTNLFKHAINTGNHPPIKCHPYRASFVERGRIKEKVDDLLKAGVLEESNSPWAAPVVLVPKNVEDGDYVVTSRN